MSESGHRFSPGPVEPFFGDLMVHTFQYSNGLVLKVVPDATAPVAAYQTWFRVGSADEEPGHTGLAHFFEHMMFKGTEVYGEGEYSKRLDSLGADGLNAWTWMDQTAFVQSVPVQHLDAVADLEATRMHRLLVDEASFRTELEVVINERRMSVDNDPGGKLSESMFATAYQSHSYRWPTIGWMADLQGLTVDDAVGFYRAWYAPDNATIVVVGDVDPARTAELVDAHYGGIEPSGAQRRDRSEEPEQTAQRRVEESFPISADRVTVAFKVPGYTHPDVPALLVLDAILTGGRTGRLNRALRDSGIVAGVSSSLYPLKDPSLFVIGLSGRPGVAAEVAEAALWAELERIRSAGASEGELVAGIRMWRAGKLGSMEDVEGKADFLGWLLTHTGDHKDGLARIDAIEDVTLDDVVRVARTYLVPERSTVAVGRAQSPAEAIEVEAPVVEPAGRVHLEARPLAGPPDLPKGEVVRTEVEGAKILCSYDPTLPLVFFRWYLHAGAAADPPGKEGLANLTARALLRGTVDRPRREFEEALEQLGASVAIYVDADGALLYGTALAETWPAFVALITEAVSRPAFRADDVEQIKLELDSQLAAIIDDDEELVGIAVRRALLGADHPYARDPRGSRDGLQHLHVDDLRRFHHRHYRAGGSIMGVSGAFDEQLLDDLGAWLGAIRGEPDPMPSFVLPEPATEQVLVLVDKPDRTQAAVRTVQVGPSVDDPSFGAFVLANDCFGGNFNARMMDEIRVKTGWSYYAYSFPVLDEHGVRFETTFAPDLDHTADAIAKLLEMLDQACTEGFHHDEVALMRSARLEGRPFLADTMRKKLSLDLRKEILGYDKLAVTDAMADLHVEELNAAFGAAIRPRGQAIAVVATADLVRDSLIEKVGPITLEIGFEELAR